MATRITVLVMVLALSLTAAGQLNNPSGLPSRSNVTNSTSVSGTVFTSDNHGARNVRVELRDLYTGQVVASTYTGPNGNFDFMQVNTGSYEVHAFSGTDEAIERLDMRSGDTNVSLRLPRPQGAEADGAATVSVAQYKVPGKARDAFHKAEKAFSKQKFDEAGADLDKALGIYPQYAEALTLRAILRLDHHNMQDAAADLDQAVKCDPNYGLAYVVMGAAYNLTSKYDDAIRSLQRGTALSPASWQAHYELAKAFLGKGDYESALRNIVHASQMAPSDYAPIHLLRAHALLGMKSYSDAMVELENYLEKTPEGENKAQVRHELEQVKAFAAQK